jgi:hypothetical protein
MCFVRRRFPKTWRTNPIPTAGRAKLVILKMDIPATNQAVKVVPMFAPSTTEIACLSVSNPAFTRPTTITVVAELD